jgi:hypothetical protein
LLIELLFQEFTRLHVELDDLIRRELKFCINHLKPRYLIFELLLLLFLLLLIFYAYYSFKSSDKPAILPVSLAATTSTLINKRIGQLPICNLQHLILNILNDRLQLEKVLLPLDLILKGLDLLVLQMLHNDLGQMSTCPLS